MRLPGEEMKRSTSHEIVLVWKSVTYTRQSANPSKEAVSFILYPLFYFKVANYICNNTPFRVTSFSCPPHWISLHCLAYLSLSLSHTWNVSLNNFYTFFETARSFTSSWWWFRSFIMCFYCLFKMTLTDSHSQGQVINYSYKCWNSNLATQDKTTDICHFFRWGCH